jgi:hypothetical protein
MKTLESVASGELLLSGFAERWVDSIRLFNARCDAGSGRSLGVEKGGR